MFCYDGVLDANLVMAHVCLIADGYASLKRQAGIAQTV